MSFLYAFALGIAALVAVPFFAHRLRRLRAVEVPFAAARLAAPTPPRARRRSRLEDRALFALRALAILALALLGASPLVRCSRLSLQRSGGASVALAIVLDDSMSMRASFEGKSRFFRAKEGAKELLASAREGDAIAIVLAGAPARVGLAATTDIGAAKAALDAFEESDRETDLDGAVGLSRGLIASLPQVDRRVVVLSDLADGNPDAAPLGEGSTIPMWTPLPELRAPAADCGLLTADRSGTRVKVAFACSQGSHAGGREITLEDAEKKVIARAPAPTGEAGEVTLTLPALPGDDAKELVAKLTGNDAIASDDTAPVVPEAGPGAIAVIAEAADETAATGGAPVVEQALASLQLDPAIRPTPLVPDREDELAAFMGVIVDDPAGFTPEQRRVLKTYIEGGGVVLLALGPRAASATLGSTLEPIVDHAVTWGDTTAKGGDPASATGALAESAESLGELAATKRTTLSPEDLTGLDVLAKWTDGAPLVGVRAMGRGEAWVTTLPFSVDASDFALRPVFLALLDGWVAAARLRSAPRRTAVGAAWTFTGASDVTAEGPSGPVTSVRDEVGARLVPSKLGLYMLRVDGKAETRVAAPTAREIAMKPRASRDESGEATVGDTHAAVDISSSVALFLLAILTAELVVRMLLRRTAEVANTAT